MVAAFPKEPRHGDGGAASAPVEGPTQGDRHFSEDAVRAMKWKCDLPKAGRETVVDMLERLPEVCVNAIVQEYATRARGEEQSKGPVMRFLVSRDAPLNHKKRCREMLRGLGGGAVWPNGPEKA